MFGTPCQAPACSHDRAGSRQLLTSLHHPCQELGAAGLTKRPTSCMLLLPKPPKGGAEGDDGKEFAESFADVHRRVKAVQPSVF